MRLSRPLALLSALTLATAALAAVQTYRLPTDAEPQLPADGDAAMLVQAHCGACHSTDYIMTQPPRQGHAFWQSEVTKMIKTFGADIPPADAATIVTYLETHR